MVNQYRSDIDGLRAIAVGGVVLYHAFPNLLSGGFVGVDVFFVLSGFLITGIIASEASAGKFSIAGFYERRFRRILPALGTMLIATTVAAFIILPPSELAAYGRSLIGVAVFASNIVFWRETGYFDSASADKPLLHTWSLAVEEQFYILWPLIAAGLIALGRRRLLGWFVWAAVIGSLAAAIVAVKLSPSQAFYMLPYRAWELGFGALLAIGAVPAFRRPIQRQAAAWIGLALVILPMLFYSDATPFPGLAAVPPCLGTVLLIHAGQGYDTRVGRILSFGPILYTGLVSYSFYLWHWPLLTLPRMALNRPLAPTEAVVAVVAAFVLAALSLRFVEKPFRGRGTFAMSRGQVILTSVFSFGLFGAVGVAAWSSGGLAAYASPAVRRAELAMASVNPLRAECHAEAQVAHPGRIDRCLGGAQPKNSRGYDVLLWGDSHADHLAPGLAQLGVAEGFAFRQSTKSGCPMTVLISRASRVPGCAEFHEAVLAEAARQPKLRAVVVSARWATTLPAMVRAAGNEAAGIARFRSVMAALVRETRAKVGPEVEIVLVGSTPEFAFWPATCFARAAKLRTDEAHCRNAHALDARWSPPADRVLASLAGPGVTAVLPRDAFCKGGICETEAGGRILFRDDDHLTNAGSLLVARRIGSVLGVAAQ